MSHLRLMMSAFPRIKDGFSDKMTSDKSLRFH